MSWYWYCIRVTVNSYPCQLAPCQLVPMSTRTHVSSYHQYMLTRTTSDVNSYHKLCQLVPQVMSARTQQGSIRWWYELTSLITQKMSTRTHVSSYHSWMLTRTIIRCQLVPKLIPEGNECRLYIRACLDLLIYVLHVLGHVQLTIQFNLIISSYKW